MELMLKISMAILMISVILSLLRIITGPSLPDRVVALDLIASIIMGIILIYSLLVEERRYIDVVVIMSLMVFMGTVMIAKYLNKEKDDN